jgi:hypothetical protein
VFEVNICNNPHSTNNKQLTKLSSLKTERYKFFDLAVVTTRIGPEKSKSVPQMRFCLITAAQIPEAEAKGVACIHEFRIAGRELFVSQDISPLGIGKSLFKAILTAQGIGQSL